MANNWAIAIGINQYQFFQPLDCAQADAEAVKDFLVTNGGFLPQQCLVITETSPPFEDRSTYPTKENILLLLEDFAATSWQPQDRLWFFFSGYGVNYKGQDYLMPVFGDPNRVEQTGIEVRSLMQSLQVANLDVLLLLDINRAFGTYTDAYVGKETIELAKELQISTILSCQPEQFSHESRELGHGFFTAALLEALRYGNGNHLTHLEKYLSVRTPELCQHYWRPTQNPVIILVPKRQAQVISPPLEDKREAKVKEVAKEVAEVAGKNTPSSSSSPSSVSSPHPQKKSSNNHFLPLVLLWSIATMLVLCLIAVFLLRDRVGVKLGQIVPPSFKSATNTRKIVDPPQPETSPSPTILTQPETQLIPEVTSSSQVTPIRDESKQSKQALLELEKMSLSQTQASDLRQAIDTAGKIPPDDPKYEKAQENIKIWSRMILDLAQTRVKQKQYANAISAAQLVPKDQAVYSKAQTSIKQWRLQAKQYVTNTTLVDAAVGLIRDGQASTYNRAIEVAKKVPRDEPGFDVAQKSINSWSENILRLAKQRANRKEFKAAIETATLVPEETAAYKQAQNAIAQWQKNSQ
ncbi:peptidase C14 [Brasilonema octagenarum UFV-E1]|uniref:Peptidase C14 n=1 Tax=Brasilonema sennae CENA114 TaxID=415709 RepID=A0A856MKT8_9CYAN|nr:caspase family protein [Brasilonema sennae]QDL11993.1 peptidase C14 [Brasilonema sennae CENA114]QDL18368.1 peptidase C14 [Brasilonema octagenarum UFV-E1]